MADRSILYRLRAALQGGFVAVAREVQLLASYPGVVTGAANAETALQRLDGTGVGAAIFTFSGPFSAQNSNIDDWFGGRQQVRLRCTSNGGVSPVNFDLPGTTALNTAFDQLVAAGLPEVLRFIIEYTGSNTTFVQIRPRIAPSPQIQDASSVIVRTGTFATLEVTRSGGTISNYIFQAQGALSGGGGGTAGAIRTVPASEAVWDASATGTLPTTSVVKGNGYRVVNAPSDGSGRFGEVMQNGDYVVWDTDTFTSWSAEPHQWFVLPAHDVRRISALEEEFLTDVAITSPVSDRNAVIRGANYADTAGEIRLKLYATRAAYTAADLNTTGAVDRYPDGTNIVNPPTQTGFLAIRLTGNLAALQSVLPTLFVYADDGSGGFTRLGNLDRDFTFEGDFGAESDYLSVEPIDYTIGDTLRIYVGQTLDRYNNPSLDIFEANLSDRIQAELNRREAWMSIAEVLFSGATVRDIHVADRVEYAEGYSRGVDWRDMSDGVVINDDRYIDGDLTIVQNGQASFEVSGFGVGIQKLIGIRLQRNDGNTGEGAMVEIAPGQALIRVNTSNQIQVNTTPGASASWSTLTNEAGAVLLASGADNFLIFEIVPIVNGNANTYEVVGAFFDGTNFAQLNNIDTVIATPNTITGDHLGFSRSVNQRGQVTEFRAIKNPGYLFHSRLESLLRQHRQDKWVFGFARLIEGSDTKEVVLQSLLALNTPTGTAAPTDAPAFIGQHYIDTAAKDVYVAVGTTDSGDWELLD